MNLAADPTVTDWITAISGIIAALGAVGAAILALTLIRKQHSALDVTTRALNDEMKWRRQERKRQHQESQDRRAKQAREVSLKPRRIPPANVAGSDTSIILFSFSGTKRKDLRLCFAVTNSGETGITNVQVAAESGGNPFCHVVDFETAPGTSAVPVLPPNESARFYWVDDVDELTVYTEFTDSAGVRWKLHHNEGLSEVSM